MRFSTDHFFIVTFHFEVKISNWPEIHQKHLKKSDFDLKYKIPRDSSVWFGNDPLNLIPSIRLEFLQKGSSYIHILMSWIGKVHPISQKNKERKKVTLLSLKKRFPSTCKLSFQFEGFFVDFQCRFGRRNREVQFSWNNEKSW